MTRLLALAGDVFAAVGLQAALGWVAFFFLGLVFGADTPSGIARLVGVVVVVAAFVGYFWVPVALFGRTLFMAVLGLAVVRRDGDVANSRRAFVRALVLPVSVLFPPLLVGTVLGRERRTIHDALSGTVEVYDWGERDAEQPVTIRQQLSARVRRQELPLTG
ncbi:MAG: RDD family protein [Acidimicrobiales bacterium]